MDGDDVALWMAGMLLVALAVQVLPRARSGDRDWLVVLSAASALALARWWSPRAATVVASTLIASVLASTWLLRLALAALAAGRVRRVAALAAPLRWAPLAALRAGGGVVRATALIGDGRPDDARPLIARLAAGRGPAAIAARGLPLALDQRWAEIVAARDAATPPARLGRALGEVGDVAMQVATYLADARAARFVGRDDRGDALIAALALSGKVEPLAALLAAQPRLADAMRAFWLGSARGAAGDRDGAAAALDAAVAARPQLATAVAWRRAWFDRPRTAPADAVVEAAVADARALVGQHAAMTHGAPLATVGAAAVYLAMHVVALRLGPSFDAALLRLGALDTGRFRAADGWRLVASSTLHAGWLHLGMNLIALLAIGPQVERAVGRARFVIVLVAGAFGCSAAVLGAHRLGWLPRQVLVGASGSLMALIGCLAVAVAARRRDGDRAARTRLRAVVAMILLQVVFDQAHARVSGTGHLGGLAAGVLVGAALMPWRRRAGAA